MVILFTGIGFSLLTAIRGLSTHITTFKFEALGNATIPILMSSLWPPRDFRIWVSASDEVDLLLLDESESLSFFSGKDPYPLREYNNLKDSIIIFEIDTRGKYSLLVRNKKETTVKGEVIITIYGFEKDLVFLSTLILTIGVTLLVTKYLISKKKWKIVKY